MIAALAALAVACSGSAARPHTPDAGHVAFDPEHCSVPGGCDDAEPQPEPAPTNVELCDLPKGEPKPVAWSHPLQSVPCPLGECDLFDPQPAAADNGDLVALASAAYDTRYGALEGGVALLRYAATGEPRGQALWDFVATPLRAAIERHAALLATDTGQLLYASARNVWPADEPRALTLSELTTDDPPRTRAPLFTSERTRPIVAAVGGGAVLVASAHHAPSPFDKAIHPSSNTQDEPIPHLTLTLFDHDGHARWNRTWPDDASARRVLALHLDAQSRSTVAIRVANVQGAHVSVLQLNADGRVRWQRTLAQGSALMQAAVDASGNVYVLSVRSELLPQRDIERIELFDADGHGKLAWDMPPDMDYTLQAGGAQRALLSSLLPSAADTAELRVYALTAADGCSAHAYDWPENDANGPIQLTAAAKSGAVYFMSSAALGRLSDSHEGL